jgi:hypothetical protein
VDRTATLKNHRPYSPAPILEGLSARQIAKLLNDGVRLSEMIRAVSEISKWLPDAGLSAVRLHVGALADLQDRGCRLK